MPAPLIKDAHMAASPGTAIGVPACTASPESQVMVNKSLYLLAKNIPAGGIKSILVEHDT